MIVVGSVLAVSLLCVIALFSLAASELPPLATVQGTVLVPRGGRVDLRPVLSFNQTFLVAWGAECRVTNIAVVNGSSCGQIEPVIFDCVAYTGPLLYQHFGCFASRELATFVVSASNSSRPTGSIQPVHASTHSIEVLVDPPHPLLGALRVEPTRLGPASEGVNLTVVFPLDMVGQCYYEVLPAWPVLSLPMAGTLEGAVNQLLPSGYVQNTPLTYQPRSSLGNTMRRHTDYVLVKLYNHKFVNRSYVILPFSIGEEGEGEEEEDMVFSIPRVYIHQAVNTPVYFTHTLPDTDLLRYTFPVQPSGNFCSVYSSAVNVSFTTFTNQELLDGLVAFYPAYSLGFNSSSFSFNISNVAGVMLARGVVVVSRELDNRTSRDNRPSQRRNLPLVVPEGGVAIINDTTLEFYVNVFCSFSLSTLQVSMKPRHGELIYSNSSQVHTDHKIPLLLLHNTSLLRYKHRGGEELVDVIYWRLECSTRPSLLVFMSVLVATVDDALPTLTIASRLMAYRGWALPISPSALQVADPDSRHQDIYFHVDFIEGTLLKASQRRAYPLQNTSNLFPLVTFNSLIPVIGKDFNIVSQFSLQDLERQKIWYIPEAEREVEYLGLTVGDSTHRRGFVIHYLDVDVSPLAPNHTLVISTATQYPYVLENKPLPLSSEGHMFLTSYFLYCRAPPSPPKDLRYVMQTTPQNGQLCLVNDSCVESVGVFTQQDINYHRLVYRPSNRSLVPDHFTFIVTVQGISHKRPAIHTFNWTLVTPTTSVIKNSFWIRTGTERIIPAELFRPFLSLLGSSDLRFQVYEQPQYGNVSVRSETQLFSPRPSHFTLQEVLNQWLWYTHISQKGPPLCGDQLLFDAVSPLGNVTGHLHILFRRGGSALSVDVTPHVLQGLTQFTFSSKDLNVSSAFCPQYVIFSIARRPLLGVLRLTDYTRNTQRELLEGSTFTAKDILTGALSYYFAGYTLEPNVNITDMFAVSASDPSSQWPAEGEGEGAGQFHIVIAPFPEAMLEVNFSRQHPVTWLPGRQSYGYVLSTADIQLLNTTTLQPREVLVQVEKELRLGRLEKRGATTSFFTVADLQEGSVVYLKNLRRLDVFNERLKLGVYAYLPAFSRRASLHQFLVEWAVVDLEHEVFTVSEDQGTLQLSIRRRGATWFESRVRVMTVPDSASPSPQDDCPSLAGDYCDLSREVVFPVGVVTQEVTVHLIDNEVAEGEEAFYVQLVEGEGLTNAILHGNVRSRVIIEDREDYNFVYIMGDADLNNCLSVQESSGQVVINLTRMGNLEQEVGVVCYTESDTAQGDTDYVSRGRGSLESVVMFGVNQSVAECRVQIRDDQEFETGERFLVHLASGGTDNFINTDPNLSSICVYISYAEEDSPVVSFNQSQVSKRENEMNITHATFMLDRHGYDLNTTTLVNYIRDLNQESTAEEGVDYRLYTSDECRLDGITTGGCVSFSPGQTQAALTVEILPDKLVEGTEVFYLRIGIVRNGKKTRDHRYFSMSITIIDGAEPTYIEFVDKGPVLMEGAYQYRLAARRRGYVGGTVTVKCFLKGITATGSLTGDFLPPSKPQSVTFMPEETGKEFSFIVLDDTIYEGMETFSATMELVNSSDPGVFITPNLTSIVIIILDEEDRPVVEFTSPDYVHVQEPVFNNTLDWTSITLTLLRTGDLSNSSSVEYTTVDGSARAGRDYVSAHGGGVITFGRGQNSTELDIHILANHQLDVDTNFSVQLSLPLSSSTNDPTIIGGNSNVTVVIDNRELLGVYFPALPRLCNVIEDGGLICTPGAMYFDLPLLCVTPCDLTFDLAGRGDWQEQCQEQGIANDRTVYTWEVSHAANASFHPLREDSMFTSTDSQQLQTAYLQLDLYVRCRAQAVDHAGVKGYSQTSDALQLSRQRYECNGQEQVGEIRGQLSTYEGFVGADEDVVLVELTVPALSNTLPVVSTSPLPPQTIAALVQGRNQATPPYEANDSEAPPLCSTLNLQNGHSLLAHEVVRFQGGRGIQLQFQPFYHHLDRLRCEWRFSAWYSLRALLEDCGGHAVGGLAPVNLTAIVTLLQFQLDGTLGIHSNQSTVMVSTGDLPPSSSPGPSTPPFHVLPEIGPSHSHLFPLSISRVDGHIQLVLYIFTPSNTTLQPWEGSEGTPQPDEGQPWEGSEGTPQPDEDLQLLFTSISGASHVWQLVTHRPGPIRLGFRGHRTGSCAECEDEYQFGFSVGVAADGRGEVSLEVQVALHHNTLAIGENISFTASLNARQQLQDGYPLQLQQLYLCEQVGQDNCSIRLTIRDQTVGTRVDLHMNMSAQSVSVEFPSDWITLLSSPSVWFLHIHLGLSSTPLYHVSTHPLTLYTPSPITTNSTIRATPTETPPPPSQSLAASTPAFAAIGILASIVIILLVCVGVSVGVACMIKGQASFQEKTLAIGKEKGLCEELNSKKGLKNSYQSPPAMKRTRSTTCFPTHEVRLKVATPPRKGDGTSNAVPPPETNSIGIHKSQSLPSILPPHIIGKSITPLKFSREPPTSTRRANPRGRTRVKKLNVDSPWTPEQLKGNRELTNQQVVQDLVLKRNKYGVNEIQTTQHTQPYARYMVRSLAASAKTPEPGSTPLTML